ncbi:MAG: hemolysin family protein [Phycisphaerae bacterium]|nr:hemolysin family protein [Phycisphaerae bacterium]
MAWLIWAAALAAIVSGFFSLAECAFHGVRRAGLREQFHDRPRRMVLLERHLAPLRMTASLGRTLANLTLVTLLLYGFQNDTGWQWSAALAALAVAAGLVTVFSVAIPHAWAAHATPRVIAVCYAPLLALRFLFYPVVAIMLACDIPVRRLAGANETSEDREDATIAQILQAATDGVAEGTVQRDEVKMIESALEFGDLQAGQIMTPRTALFALPVETTWQQACDEVVRAGHTRIPVYSDDLDNIIGILYAKDLLRHVGSASPVELRAIIRKPIFVPESKPLNDLLKEFRGRKIHMAIVLDEYGGTAGLVTIEDVLEEIVGEISDEYDRGEPALLSRVDERTIEADGKLYIDDLNDALGLDVPEDENYITIAGLVFSELGYIPQPGETFDAFDARFIILAADERKITRLRVERLTKTDGEKL